MHPVNSLSSSSSESAATAPEAVVVATVEDEGGAVGAARRAAGAVGIEEGMSFEVMTPQKNVLKSVRVG